MLSFKACSGKHEIHVFVFEFCQKIVDAFWYKWFRDVSSMEEVEYSVSKCEGERISQVKNGFERLICI